MRVQFKVLGIVFFFIFTTTSYFFFKDSPSSAPEVLSTYQKALVINSHLDNDKLNNVLLASDIIANNVQIKTLQASLKIQNEKLLLDQEFIFVNLPAIIDDHYSILDQLSSLITDYNSINYLDPREKLILSFYFDEPVTSLAEKKVGDIKINSNDLLVLQKFAYSTEFLELLERGEMSSDYLDIEYLKDTQRNSKISYQKDFNSDFN